MQGQVGLIGPQSLRGAVIAGERLFPPTLDLSSAGTFPESKALARHLNGIARAFTFDLAR
jgi:hypothetical protein